MGTLVEKHQIEGLERVYRVEFFDRLGKTITVVTLPENSLRFPAPLRTRVKLINHAGVKQRTSDRLIQTTPRSTARMSLNNMSKISIEVSPETAAAYQSASSEEKERVRILIDLLMRRPSEDDSDFLGKLMDEISDRAEARGLTPEILESLLNEP